MVEPNVENLDELETNMVVMRDIHQDSVSLNTLSPCWELNINRHPPKSGLWEHHRFSDTELEVKAMEDDDASTHSSSTPASEDSYDKEQWHRTVLKACTRHASRIDMSKLGPLPFVLQGTTPGRRLRVELDSMIPIPLSLRRLWYLLQHDIRTFTENGLLLPAEGGHLEDNDHWRNNNMVGYRRIPRGILVRALAMPPPQLRLLFHPACSGKVTLTAAPTARELGNLIGNESKIRQMYDKCYWKAIYNSQLMDVDPSSPRRAYGKIRAHDRRSATMMTGAQWRAHHYFMWDAIQRNRSASELPVWFGTHFISC